MCATVNSDYPLPLGKGFVGLEGEIEHFTLYYFIGNILFL